MNIIFRVDLYTHKKTITSCNCSRKWRKDSTPKFCPAFVLLNSSLHATNWQVFDSGNRGIKFVAGTLPVKQYNPDANEYPETKESKRIQSTVKSVCKMCGYKKLVQNTK